MNVRDVAQDYLASITHLNIRTRASYAQRLMIFAEWCTLAGVALEQVNNELVHRFLKHLYETRKPHKAGRTELSMHTLAGYLRVIRAFLIWCLQDDRYAPSVSFRVVRAIRFDQSTL